MDARIIKTKKAIKEAFLDLRKKQPLEKIRVKEICEIAIINKATFYKYYQDVFDLSDKIEDECLDRCQLDVEGSYALFSDPMAFIKGVPAFESDEDLKTLFCGRENLLIEKIKARLFSLYETAELSTAERIKLYFIVNGGMDTLQQLTTKGISKEEIESVIAELILKL